jgi:DNA (cytosine-5)-methyltransferase 1
MSMTFGSVCSGIEAASVAFAPLGWVAAWLAEIDKFPGAVLAHHYPNTPNLGDMTKIARAVLTSEVEAPDVLCGGTPCQAFSVAGLRQSLADARGNLTLKFVELADAIDHVRGLAGKPACTILWENVPGVLSTKDNAFGCFLAGLAGEDDPLQPPGEKWANAGCVYGPTRAIAWRTLDAQYFGLAQRRRRVFVVASARQGFDPATVLFEWDGVRRDSAPSRKAGEVVTPTIRAGAANGGAGHGARSGDSRDELIVPHTVGSLTAACGPNAHGGSGLATDKGAEAGHILAFGGNRTSGPIEISPALLAQPGSGWKGDFESEAFITTHTLRGEGFDASEDGTGRGTPLVPVFDRTYQIPMVGESSDAYWQRIHEYQAEHGITASMLSDGTSFTTPVHCIKGAAIGRADTSGPQYGEVLSDVSYTQNCPEVHAVQTATAVRRLTPRNVNP